MFKLLTIGVTITLIYLSFVYVGEYDSNVQILMDNLQIEMSLFTLIVLLFLSLFSLLIIIKMLAIALNLPSILCKKWKRFKNKKINAQLMQALIEFIGGDKNNAVKLVMAIYNDLNSIEAREIANVIIADSAEQNEVKIEYYKILLKSDKLSNHALKKLAEVYLQEKEYLKAEKLALKYFDRVENDQENIVTLLKIYIALKQWQKISLLSVKMQNMKNELWNEASSNVADCFYDAACDAIKNKNEEEAKNCLERSLELKPGHIPSLNLYTELSINNNNVAAATQVLKAAFKANTCFSIGRMYVDCSSSDPEILYKDLASIADPKSNSGTFLALAAYLGLEEMISVLKKNS